MKKAVSFCMASIMAFSLLAGCKAASDNITVVSREDGSGTRGAFTELFGIEVKDDSGAKIDQTLSTAEVTNSTAVMMTTVEANDSAIGYISLGSLNRNVRAVKIDGVEASVENIKNGSYKISRPFNIATLGEVSEQAADFMAYILSDEGQGVVEINGYISQGSTGPYTGGAMTGKVTIAGSSSVTPVMEKLTEAYKMLNPDVEIELQQSDSSTGMSSTIEGMCDIGMASRELKDSEIEAGLAATVIAMDGIAVIVSNDSKTYDLTKEQVRQIYTGEVTAWSEIQ